MIYTYISYINHPYPIWLKAHYNLVLATMAPMKAMKAIKFMKTSKVMTKRALIKAIAEKHELETKGCSGLLLSLATPATADFKKNGIFTIPGLSRIRTSLKPAT